MKKQLGDELSIFLSRYGYQIEAPDNFENVIENIKESKARPNIVRYKFT